MPAFAQSPDTVLINGKILTVDAQSSVREALAVRDGRIVALGTTAEMRKPIEDICKTLKISRATLYRYVQM